MSNDSHRVFRGINIFCFFFPLACSFDFEDGIGGWERRGTAFICQPTFGDNPEKRNRENARQQGDWWIGGGGWESNQRKRFSGTAALRWCRPTSGNSHFSLFPYRWQKYLVFNRWRMYHKRYPCRAYCRQTGEIIHFDHYVSFDSSETA